MKHIVIDLEMNPGAVRLDADFQEEARFQCYVCPEYGSIRRTIRELTGITEEKVAGKPHYKEAFHSFIDWVGDETVKIYSWSLSDVKQLRSECRYKLPDFDIQWLDSRWIDLQRAFDDRLGLHHSLALKHALGAMDHKFEGTAHTALDDAINTSAILALMQDEVKFRRTMQPVIDILQPKDELSDSIGDLFPELGNLKLDK